MTDTAPVAAARTTKLSRQQRKAVLAGSVGNAVEWIDWALYATLAPIFAGQFFGSKDPTVNLLSTLAIFAVGFVMRPVGGAVLGAYADRHGRKKGLTLTITMMAGASIVIGLTPNYASVGLLAPVILLLSRLVQGFSAGGEFGSSSSFLVESAASGRRAFAGSWQQVSVGSGVLVASGTSYVLTRLLSDDQMSAFGWRIAFVIGGLLGLLGLWLRMSVHETDSFTKAEASGRTRGAHPMVGIFTKHPRAALRVVGITVAGTLLYYIWMSFMPGYASTTTDLSLSSALLVNTISVAYFIALLPLVGLLSDRFGRKITLFTFAFGFLVFAYPAFAMLKDADFGTLLIVELIGVTLLTGYSANCAVIMTEQFPPEVRATGIGLPYAAAVALFGGTAPYITTWMANHGHRDQTWIYVAAAALIGCIVYATMPETKDKEFV